MALRFCGDLSAADWIVNSDRPWPQLVGFGPAGFDSYARLRFLPDPVRPGQSENEVQAEWRGQLPALFEVLAAHTTTPDDCFFCVWDGFGQGEGALADDAGYLGDEDAGAELEQPDARPGWVPVALPSISPRMPLMPQLPKVVVPHRAYWLFRGPLAEVGSWDGAREWPGQCRLDEAEPAFTWPADHAWCVARDVDPHWAGIGGTHSLIAALMADPRLDLVPADPAQAQPAYR